LVQGSLFDGTRAPAGKQTGWAYCHVPNGSSLDMTERIEAQVERFAPGFRDRILARATSGPADLEAYDPNYVGGDINGGIQDLRQLVTRPRVQEGLELGTGIRAPWIHHQPVASAVAFPTIGASKSAAGTLMLGIGTRSSSTSTSRSSSRRYPAAPFAGLRPPRSSWWSTH
jgi:hypothetical protein